jgi:molecular chaperone DnaJ
MKKDFYEILGVSKSATPAEIKKAYRKKAIQYHPDKNPDDKEAEEMFKAAAEAYEVLSDPDKKARYDQFGHDAYQQAGGFGGGAQHMNMDDIFSQFGDIFGDIFGGRGGFSGFNQGGQRQRTVRSRGTDLRVKLKVTLEDIIKGGEKKIKIKRKVKASGTTYQTCPQCHGSGSVSRVTNTIFGRMQTTGACNVCNGTGQVLKNRASGSDGNGMIVKEDVVSINLPKGVRNGVQLRIGGKGNEAPAANGIAGDLIVQLIEVADPKYKREGNNLHYDLYVSIPEAVLGTAKIIETPHGKIKLNLEEGLQPGKILRLKNKGVPDIDGYGAGDLLINVNVWVPKKLDDEQKAFFKKNIDNPNFHPKPSKSDKSFFEKIHDLFS